MDDDLRQAIARIKSAKEILKSGTRLTPRGLRQRYIQGADDVDLLIDGLFIEEESDEDDKLYEDFFGADDVDDYALAVAMAATVVLDLGQ